jgi:hypothetical protein
MYKKIKKEENKEISAVRQEAQKQAVLEQLRRMPIVSAACKRAGMSRANFYRLRNSDNKFRSDIELAITEGVETICEMGEYQIVSLIKNGNFAAAKFWLQSHHSKYSRKFEILGKVDLVSEELTEEEKQIIEEALRIALPQNQEINEQEYEQQK